MAERLREVTEQLTGDRVDLLGEYADVVDVPGGVAEHVPGLLGTAGERERLGQPERAEQERPLLAGQAVAVAAPAVR